MAVVAQVMPHWPRHLEPGEQRHACADCGKGFAWMPQPDSPIPHWWLEEHHAHDIGTQVGLPAPRSKP